MELFDQQQAFSKGLLDKIGIRGHGLQLKKQPDAEVSACPQQFQQQGGVRVNNLENDNLWL